MLACTWFRRLHADGLPLQSDFTVKLQLTDPNAADWAPVLMLLLYTPTQLQDNTMAKAFPKHWSGRTPPSCGLTATWYILEWSHPPLLSCGLTATWYLLCTIMKAPSCIENHGSTNFCLLSDHFIRCQFPARVYFLLWALSRVWGIGVISLVDGLECRDKINGGKGQWGKSLATVHGVTVLIQLDVVAASGNTN